MSLPSDTQTPQSAPVAPQPGQMRPRKRRVRLTLWLLLFLAVAFAIVQAPLEMGRWRLASAVRLRQKNEKEAAYAELEKAIASFPKSPELLLQRAEWRFRDKEIDEALADAQRAVDVSPDNPSVRMARVELFWKMGRFREAVDDCKRVEEFSRRSGIPSRDEALNGLAYAQALAKAELDEALKNVNEAIEVQPSPERETAVQRSRRLNQRAQMLDTRGYILHLLGRNEDALIEMDKAVQDLKQSRSELQKPATPSAENDANSEVAATPIRLPSDARSTAVIHYHRALILKALDRSEDAEKDWTIARQLIGREPDETLF